MASIQGGGSALSSHSSNNAPLSRPHIYQSRASLCLCLCFSFCLPYLFNPQWSAEWDLIRGTVPDLCLKRQGQPVTLVNIRACHSLCLWTCHTSHVCDHFKEQINASDVAHTFITAALLRMINGSHWSFCHILDTQLFHFNLQDDLKNSICFYSDIPQLIMKQSVFYSNGLLIEN